MYKNSNFLSPLSVLRAKEQMEFVESPSDSESQISNHSADSDSGSLSYEYHEAFSSSNLEN